MSCSIAARAPPNLIFFFYFNTLVFFPKVMLSWTSFFIKSFIIKKLVCVSNSTLRHLIVSLSTLRHLIVRFIISTIQGFHSCLVVSQRFLYVSWFFYSSHNLLNNLLKILKHVDVKCWDDVDKLFNKKWETVKKSWDDKVQVFGPTCDRAAS